MSTDTHSDHSKDAINPGPANEAKISSSLSAFSSVPQLSKGSVSENNFRKNLTEMKFSAQNQNEPAPKKLIPQSSILMIQKLLQQQKAKKVESQKANPKKVDF